MSNPLDDLPAPVKTAAMLMSGGLVALSILKGSSIIDALKPSSPPPTVATVPSQPSSLSESITVRLNFRDDKTKESIPDVKVELLYLGGATLERADSSGFLDVKIPKTSTAKIFMRKDGYTTADRQLDPNINIPQDRNMTLYLVPVEKTPPPKPETSSPDRGNTSGTSQSSPSGSKDLPVKNVKPESVSVEKSPKDFMNDFYVNINSRNLDNAWQMLSDKRQAEQKDGFSTFKEWWGEKVQKVNVKNIDLLKKENGRAEVKARVEYVINGKTVQEEPITYHLGFSNGKWKILSKNEI
jgi:hypothetical protein